MHTINWYYPKDTEELKVLLEKDGVYPHGGGTSILRLGFKNIKGLIALDDLKLNFFKKNASTVEIGSALSFSALIENLREVDKSSILIKALSNAVPTPLRNRITIGGSIASFPIWSDLIGPLFALDADLKLIGSKEGIYKLAEYIKNKELQKSNLIYSVEFPLDTWSTYYYRATRVNFDYSSFNFSILAKKDNAKLNDLRIVLVGSKDKCKRMTKVEQLFVGKDAKDFAFNKIQENFDTEFSHKKLGSSEYLKKLACVELERGLEQIINT